MDKHEEAKAVQNTSEEPSAPPAELAVSPQPLLPPPAAGLVAPPGGFVEPPPSYESVITGQPRGSPALSERVFSVSGAIDPRVPPNVAPRNAYTYTTSSAREQDSPLCDDYCCDVCVTSCLAECCAELTAHLCAACILEFCCK